MGPSLANSWNLGITNKKNAIQHVYKAFVNKLFNILKTPKIKLGVY